MPMPRSVTVNTSWSEWNIIPSCTGSPCGQYFTALLSRLLSMWRMRRSSSTQRTPCTRQSIWMVGCSQSTLRTSSIICVNQETQIERLRAEVKPAGISTPDEQHLLEHLRHALDRSLDDACQFRTFGWVEPLAIIAQ